MTIPSFPPNGVILFCTNALTALWLAEVGFYEMRLEDFCPPQGTGVPAGVNIGKPLESQFVKVFIKDRHASELAGIQWFMTTVGNRLSLSPDA